MKPAIFLNPEFEKAYQTIKNDILRNINPVNSPVAIVLGGQPGSGKSGLYAIASKRFQHNIAEIDCDRFRRYHPDSENLVLNAATYGDATNPFAFAVADRLVEELGEQKYNMIIESSMKSPNTAFQNYDLLSPQGYAIEAQIMATPKEVSWKGVLDRYNEQLANGELARMVPKEFHDMVVDNIPNSLDEIYRSGKMSNILIYNRKRECLYNMQNTPELNPSKMLTDLINGKQQAESEIVLHVAQPEPLTPENSYYKIVSEQELSALQKEKGLYHEARRTPNGEIIVRCHKNDKERMLSVIESAAKHLKL